MARIVVIGGHGRTGKLIVDRLIKNGDAVVATIRNPKHMASLVKAGAETVVLDLDLSPGSEFARFFKGADAIVFAAGSAEGESSALDRKGMLKAVRAAEKAGVKRYVAIASIGASTGLKLTGQWATAEMVDYYKQKRAANKTLRASSLDWTIVEPGGLTEGKAKGLVTLSEAAIPEKSISRADVAAVVVAVLGLPGSVGKTFQLTAGTTPIEAALKSATGAGRR